MDALELPRRADVTPVRQTPRMTTHLSRPSGWAKPAAVAAAALALTLVAGCSSSSGSSSPSATSSATTNGLEKLAPAEILTKTKAAIDAASSVHVKGESGGVTLDLTVGRTASVGSIILDGNTIEVLSVGGSTYMKAGKAFWATLSPAAATVLADKYVKVGAGATSQFKAFADYSTFLDGLTTSQGTPKLTGQAVVNGVKVVQLADDATTPPGVLSIANVGDPLPVQITDGGSGGGSADFSGWSQPVPAKAPPASQVLDYSKVVP